MPLVEELSAISPSDLPDMFRGTILDFPEEIYVVWLGGLEKYWTARDSKRFKGSGLLCFRTISDTQDVLSKSQILKQASSRIVTKVNFDRAVTIAREQGNGCLILWDSIQPEKSSVFEISP